MTTTASSVIRRVVDAAQDATSIRWPAHELVRYLNDGQRAIANLRPDLMEVQAPLALVGGSRQSIPAGGLKLLDISRNSGGNKRAIRLANREILDAQVPGWQGLTGVTEILHFTFDPREPRAFLVYPPAAASGASVETLYSSYPTDIAEPADGALYTAVVGNISVPDIAANPLADYILSRAYGKDAEYAGNTDRAAAHHLLFLNALKLEGEATKAAAPGGVGNPNS